jgi:DNA-binding transcriptional MocR family regulator
MDNNELNNVKEKLHERYNMFKMQNLNLDMSRGKPCKDQLDLSNDLIKMSIDDSELDLRNYGGLDGLPKLKELFAEILELSKDEIIIGGNSSLNLMHDNFVRALVLGVYNGESWNKSEKIKFLCPSPGYDRHFSICELFGVEMITIKMNDDGPDMDEIKNLVENDDSIKGMWCVPKYSNPTGISYSNEVIRKIAALKPKANNFRIFWDNAYCLHHLDFENKNSILNILEECKKQNNEDIVYIFVSTSKITLAGSGVSIFAASKNNIDYIKKQLSMQTIGPDKINQYKHLKFLKNTENIENHMKNQAKIIKPKFDKVISIFEEEFKGLEIADWTNPKGGYFISFNALEGCAKKIVSLAKEAGVKMTGAGATFPYKKDPKDNNIRIAPTVPALEELETAMRLFCTCVKIISIEKILQNRS